MSTQTEEPTIRDRIDERPSLSVGNIKETTARELLVRFAAGALTSVASGLVTLGFGARVGDRGGSWLRRTVVGLNRRRLAIYLNDHLAASTGAVELVRRAAGSNRGTHYGELLAELQTEIEQDRAALSLIMERLKIGTDRARQALAWSAEKLGRLKLNGQLTGYSPLSRLEELDMLVLVVTGKLLMWEALRQSAPAGLAEAELSALIERARSQRERLERARLEAAGEALTA